MMVSEDAAHKVRCLLAIDLPRTYPEEQGLSIIENDVNDRTSSCKSNAVNDLLTRRVHYLVIRPGVDQLMRCIVENRIDLTCHIFSTNLHW